MYRNPAIDTSENPVFASGSFPSEEQYVQMLADDADALRCESAMTEAEIELLAARHEREAMMIQAAVPVAPAATTPAAAGWNESGTRVSVRGRKFKAEARIQGGRWVPAGTFAVEGDAWNAADLMLATLNLKAAHRILAS